MKIVCAEQARVEVELLGGLLACPSCQGTLGPWGHARERVTRRFSGDWRWRPRRARCRGCQGTHVLLADLCLLRRQDEVDVIGVAIEAHVAGEGHRPIAARLGVPAGTVRGWLRRFDERAEQVRALFTWCAVALDPMLGPIMPAGRRRRGCVGGDRGCGTGVGVAVRSVPGVAGLLAFVGGWAAGPQHEFPRDRGAVS